MADEMTGPGVVWGFKLVTGQDVVGWVGFDPRGPWPARFEIKDAVRLAIKAGPLPEIVLTVATEGAPLKRPGQPAVDLFVHAAGVAFDYQPKPALVQQWRALVRAGLVLAGQIPRDAH